MRLGEEGAVVHLFGRSTLLLLMTCEDRFWHDSAARHRHDGFAHLKSSSGKPIPYEAIRRGWPRGRKQRMTHPIEASALRIGMFVHLNVGWMSHPFPLSSFKI